MVSKISGISRRRFLARSAAAATVFELGRAARALGLPAGVGICRLTPEEEQGPYYVPGELLRSGIAEGKPGIPLSLRILVLDARNCKPLANAAIDLWHCDALGVYSGYTKQNPRGPGGPGGFGGPPPGFDPEHPGNRPGPPENLGPPHLNPPTDKLTFLRGIQVTGPDGVVAFQTIFPGFYMGRTNHIHFKVRVGGQKSAKSFEAGHISHTGQLFFPEQVTADLMHHEPYRRHAIHRTTPDEDGVFLGQDGKLCVAELKTAQPGEERAGMRAEFVASVDPTATPTDRQRHGGPAFTRREAGSG